MINPFDAARLIPGVGTVVGAAKAVSDIVGDKDVIPGFDPFTNRSKNTNSGSRRNTTNKAQDANKDTSPDTPASRSTSESSTRTYNPAEIAAIERQIARTQDTIGRIGGQKGSALANILGQYQQERARLDNKRIDTETDYKNDRNRTIGDFARTKERIGENVRQNVSSLQRLLGSRGAGSSSAAQIMAPYAAARAGTTEQEQAGQEFSTNLNALDTNWKRFDREWQNSVRDLDSRKINQERATQADYASKEADLQNSLADLRNQLSIARGGGRVDTGAIEARITDLLNQIDSLGRQDFASVIRANDPQYAAPELTNYQIETRGVEQQQQDPTYQETQAFYPVREDEEDRFLQSLYQA